MNKEHLETIKKGYQWWLEAENQADKNEFAECITTEDVPALIAEVERLQKEISATQKHLETTERHLKDFRNFEFEERTEKERLREALEFYADEENYEWHEINDLETVPGDVLNDNGKTARQALGVRKNDNSTLQIHKSRNR